MKIRRILRPGQPGTKKLLKTYGENLLCVRYRYDAEKKLMFKTIEIIIESKPWEPEATELPRNEIVNIRIAIDENDSRKRVKAAGGKRVPKRQVWQLAYEKLMELGLSDRIVGGEPS